MQPGTGKTRTAYELVKSARPDYILWLTPFQTKQNLRDELDKCGGLDCDIVGIESLSSSGRTYLNVLEKITPNSFVVCDESIKIKNWSAVRSKRIIEIGRQCGYRLVLNGTPITRNLLDIWSQFEFLSPRILGMGLAEFENTFCEKVKITKRQNGRVMRREFIGKYHNVDYLYSLINPYVFECELELTIDKDHRNVQYNLSEEEHERYQEMKHKYLDNDKLAFLNNNIFLEMTMKMQHEYCCTENKFEKLKEILSSHDRSRVIVYTKFIRSRVEVENRFPDVQVLSYGKHALGLNMQKYNVTIYFDKTFDYLQMTQSEFRTYRTGQKDDCVYYRMTGNVGLEKMIDDNINKKQSLLDYFKKVGAEQIKKEL